MSTSGAKARKSSNRVSWDWFSRLLEPTPEIPSESIGGRAGWAGPGGAGTLPGIGFVDFWNQGQNLIKSSPLGLVFSISGANARKCLNRASWDSFCRLLEPRPESHQIKLPGTGFLDFWSQRRKSSNQASWDSFCRLLEPRPESHQIESPGTSFLDYWSQRQKSQAKAFQTPKRTSLC